MQIRILIGTTVMRIASAKFSSSGIYRYFNSSVRRANILITMTFFLSSKQYKWLIFLTQRGTETLIPSLFNLRTLHEETGKQYIPPKKCCSFSTDPVLQTVQILFCLEIPGYLPFSIVSLSTLTLSFARTDLSDLQLMISAYS